MGGRLVSRFAAPKTERVELEGDDWVDIRTQLRFGDRLAIEEKLYSGGIKDDGTPSTLNLGAASIEALMRGIAAWGGPGFCEQAEHPHEGECQPKPINAANIEALDATGEFLINEIRDRQVSSTPGLKATPTGSTSSTSPGRTPSPSGSLAGSTRSSSSSDSAGPGTSS